MCMKLKKDKKNLFSHLFIRNGVTLVELMIAMSLLSIGVLGMIGSFAYLNKGLQVTKGRSLANNLAQEKIEFLKNKSYYQVLVTTETNKNYNFNPPIEYDTSPNGMEEVGAGGINFKRYVHVRKVAEDAGGDFSYIGWNQPDTGMKEIEVHVVWKEGSDWKQLDLRNVRENIERTNLSATFSGTIDESVAGNKLENVTVKALENPSRFGITDIDGNYSFAIEAGSYTLRASTVGYFSSLSELIDIEESEALTKDFTLTKMFTGTISGTVYTNDHLVISQVVGSTKDAGGCYQEWVEVYNPTTWTWTMATGLNSGVIDVAYQGQGGVFTPIIYNYPTLTLAPQHYYLFANRATITAEGTTVNADAYTAGTCVNVIKINTDPGNNAAGVRIGWYATSEFIDMLGWKTGGVYPPIYEGTPLNENIGFQANEMYIRRTGPGVMIGGDARTYDSNNNINDFVVHTGVAGPKTSSDSEVPATGTPADGAIVYADDGISNSAVVDSGGNFTLVDVATGSWTVYISSGLSFISSGTFGGTSHGFADSMNVVLDSTTTMGYISGTVEDINGHPIEDIVVYAGGSTADTDILGYYVLGVEPETMDLIANYDTQNSQYVQTSSMSITVALGEMVKNVDITLSEGGKLSGWITTNGVDPLPDVPVAIFKNGIESGAGISGNDGYFYINDISSGTYVIETQLEAGESSSPTTISITVAANDDLFIGTFIVSGAMGYITGDVTVGSGADEEIINTGVLIYASIDTIASTPPTLNSALCSGSVIYYAVSSNFDGTYSLPVRGGYTYNVYAWYTTWSGDTPTVHRDEHEGVDAVTVFAGGTVERDFNW